MFLLIAETIINLQSFRYLVAYSEVDMISQNPIAPGQTFTYEFTADPVGTMWYHSHPRAGSNTSESSETSWENKAFRNRFENPKTLFYENPKTLFFRKSKNIIFWKCKNIIYSKIQKHYFVKIQKHYLEITNYETIVFSLFCPFRFL